MSRYADVVAAIAFARIRNEIASWYSKYSCPALSEVISLVTVPIAQNESDCRLVRWAATIKKSTREKSQVGRNRGYKRALTYSVSAKKRNQFLPRADGRIRLRHEARLFSRNNWFDRQIPFREIVSPGEQLAVIMQK